MATIRQILEENKGKFVDYEIYTVEGEFYNFNIHTDFITYWEPEEISFRSYVLDYEIMNESRYNETILVNTSDTANFSEWYDDKAAKVLVIIVNDRDFIPKGQTMKIYLRDYWNMNVSPNELIEIIENPENLYHSDFVDWVTVLYMMDDEIRNKVIKLYDSKNKVEFLKTYLQNASEDLYI